MRVSWNPCPGLPVSTHSSTPSPLSARASLTLRGSLRSLAHAQVWTLQSSRASRGQEFPPPRPARGLPGHPSRELPPPLPLGALSTRKQGAVLRVPVSCLGSASVARVDVVKGRLVPPSQPGPRRPIRAALLSCSGF